MSRTRIVKGSITKITGGNYKVYSRDNIENIGSKVIQVGKEGGVTYGEPENPPLAPQPIKIVVQFRPHTDWKGEFGFDWYRLGDTSLFRDRAFKDIVAYQYIDDLHTSIVDDSKPEYVNKKDGSFKLDEPMLKELQRLYKPYNIPWKTKRNSKTGKVISKEDYYIPWMSLLKDKEAKITFSAEILQEADCLEFAPTDYFTFTPNRIETKGKKKIALNEFEITIKCIEEFTTDQTLVLKAYKKEKNETLEAIAGKLNVWANDTSKQKSINVVFVEIKTKLSTTSTPKIPNVINEKERINNYLGQAYIHLSEHSDIVELDLTSDPDFHHFITSNAIDRKKTFNYRSLDVHLKEKLEEQHKGKYTQHFKAFYFAEKGYGGPLTNLNGYSADGADFVVAFSKKDDQTVAHEFLHSFGIAHTFTNKHTDKNAQFTFYYQTTDNLMDYVEESDKNKRVSLYYWQWKIANASIK